MFTNITKIIKMLATEIYEHDGAIFACLVLVWDDKDFLELGD